MGDDEKPETAPSEQQQSEPEIGPSSEQQVETELERDLDRLSQEELVARDEKDGGWVFTFAPGDDSIFDSAKGFDRGVMK